MKFMKIIDNYVFTNILLKEEKFYNQHDKCDNVYLTVNIEGTLLYLKKKTKFQDKSFK